MNKKISIAVGAAAFAALGGVAVAADLNIINNTENYADPGNATGFLPIFVDECSATANATSTSSGTVTMMQAMSTTGVAACAAHGNHAMAGAAAGTFFAGVEFVVPFNNTENSGYSTLLDPGFDNGLFNTDGTSYFSGLNLGWSTIADADANLGGTPDIPMGMPTTASANQRNEWIDQIVVGYVISTDAGTGAVELKQNFRSELSWVGGASDVSLAKVAVDQRLEQQVNLLDPGVAFEASRQTFQQAIGTLGGSATTQPDTTPGTENGLAQLVSQDIEGYLFSCLNCDTPSLIASGGSHAWTPTNAGDYSFVPYTSQWHSVPSIVHAPN
ncbi:MAG: hypothetical protein OEY97_09765 [Nitrospirota bacterium]|nr:hypothetical protein [Nitrospirota bacterium]